MPCYCYSPWAGMPFPPFASFGDICGICFIFSLILLLSWCWSLTLTKESLLETGVPLSRDRKKENSFRIYSSFLMYVQYKSPGHLLKHTLLDLLVRSCDNASLVAWCSAKKKEKEPELTKMHLALDTVLEAFHCIIHYLNNHNQQEISSPRIWN